MEAIFCRGSFVKYEFYRIDIEISLKTYEKRRIQKKFLSSKKKKTSTGVLRNSHHWALGTFVSDRAT